MNIYRARKLLGARLLVIFLVDYVDHLVLLERQFGLRVLCIVVIQRFDNCYE